MMKKQNPDTDYYFIIGADSLYDFDSWMNPDRICQNCILVVAVRNHTSVAELDREMERLSLKYKGRFLRLDTMNIDISSETIRDWIKEKKSIRYYVADQVISYIEENHIYSPVKEKG